MGAGRCENIVQSANNNNNNIKIFFSLKMKLILNWVIFLYAKEHTVKQVSILSPA
jgi:hypothetical protein